MRLSSLHAWARVVPFAALILGLALAPLFFGEWPWQYAARMLVVGVLLAWVWPRLSELKENHLSALDFGKAAFIGFLVFLLWIWASSWLNFSSLPTKTHPPWPSEEIAKPLWIASRVVGAVLIVPVVEEVFWRSYLMRRIDAASFLDLSPASVSWLAIVLSSVVFALAHKQLAAGFFAGLIYGCLYKHSSKLWMPILAHAITNLALATYVVSFARYDLW